LQNKQISANERFEIVGDGTVGLKGISWRLRDRAGDVPRLAIARDQAYSPAIRF